MKKFLYPLIALASCLNIAIMVSCSSDEEKPKESLQKDYITIENAVFHAGSLPQSTTETELTGVDMSDQVMNGAMNFITVQTDQDVSRFFIGIKGVDGYLEYAPTSGRASSSFNTYVIPLMISNNFQGTQELIMNAELIDGSVTIPGNFPLFPLETRDGALEVKLAFSNEKDIDLHVFTPSGIHIYYSTSYDGYYYGDGEVFEFGLDIDSNAGCGIDGINKENIYIPDEFIENGTYRVAVDLYSNCDPSIPTSWSIVTRYNGNLITPTSGKNPASGEFEIGAASSHNSNLVDVMTFTISGARSSRSAGISTPAPITPEEVKERLPEAVKQKIATRF